MVIKFVSFSQEVMYKLVNLMLLDFKLLKNDLKKDCFVIFLCCNSFSESTSVYLCANDEKGMMWVTVIALLLYTLMTSKLFHFHYDRLGTR